MAGHGPPEDAFLKNAALLTVVALIILVGLYLVVPGRVDEPDALLALHPVLISILTLPHVVVVCLMDRRQGIWRW